MQFSEARTPFLFFFYMTARGSLTVRDSVVHAPCGGRGPAYMMGRLEAWAPAEARYTVQESAGTAQWIDSGPLPLIDSLGTASTLRIINTTLVCYPGVPSGPQYPFAAEEVPENWNQRAEEVAARPEQCQRRATYGADYRGTANSVGDVPCQFWNATAPVVRCASCCGESPPAAVSVCIALCAACSWRVAAAAAAPRLDVCVCDGCAA